MYWLSKSFQNGQDLSLSLSHSVSPSSPLLPSPSLILRNWWGWKPKLVERLELLIFDREWIWFPNTFCSRCADKSGRSRRLRNMRVFSGWLVLASRCAVVPSRVSKFLKHWHRFIDLRMLKFNTIVNLWWIALLSDKCTSYGFPEKSYLFLGQALNSVKQGGYVMVNYPLTFTFHLNVSTPAPCLPFLLMGKQNLLTHSPEL